MKERNLKNFFSPKSIMLVGASENKVKVGGILFDKIHRSKSEVIPINPNYEKIDGVECYSSIESSPKGADLAVIATPAYTVNEIVVSCAKKKIKNIIVISAGFSEVKNEKLQEELCEITKKHGINLLGPNCFGIFNPEMKLDLTFSNTSPKKGSTVFISQSGALWSYISDLDLGFSGFVSLGNMVDLSFNDWINYFIKDKKTKKIVLYIEKLTEGREFIEICKGTKKQIIAIKAGQTKGGSEATVSHTASIATDYAIYNGAFNQAGVRQVESLIEAFNLKSQRIPLKKDRSVIITNAGGSGALLVDRLIKQGHKVKQPIDILGTATAKDYKRELDKLEKKKYPGNVIVILTPQTMSEPKSTAKIIVESKLKKNIVALFLGDKSIGQAKRILERGEVTVVTKI